MARNSGGRAWEGGRKGSEVVWSQRGTWQLQGGAWTRGVLCHLSRGRSGRWRLLRLVAAVIPVNFLRGGWVCNIMRREGRDLINGDAIGITYLPPTICVDLKVMSPFHKTFPIYLHESRIRCSSDAA